MSAQAFHLAFIAGSAARAAKRSAANNPHPADSALYQAWWAGYRDPEESVARETKPRPGRGRGALGPRSEWSEHDLDLLTRCLAEECPYWIAARICHRTVAAVTVQASRLRRRVRIAA
jgi:hypothetical protein